MSDNPPDWGEPVVPPAWDRSAAAPARPWGRDRGYTEGSAPARRGRLGVLAIVLGCAAVLVLPVVCGPTAIVLGLVARAWHQPYAVAGILCGFGGLVVGTVLAIVVLDSFT